MPLGTHLANVRREKSNLQLYSASIKLSIHIPHRVKSREERRHAGAAHARMFTAQKDG
jgi:hypothetical protein